jgi:cyclase
MQNIRVIARLDIKGPNLVKGIHLEGLRVLGKPERFASLYERNSLLPIVERTAREIFVPLTVGGGLRSIDDIRQVLRAGADKVALNTAAIRRPELIREAANEFGSSTIVVSIEALRKPEGHWECFTDNGREKTGVNALEWATRAAELGAGELMVTSIDQEGTGRGFDLELTRRVADSVTVPVIAGGGAGQPAHVADVVKQGHADAVAVASILHYRVIQDHANDAEFAAEGNIEYLKNARPRTKITGTTLPEIKQHLLDHGVPCRPARVAEVRHG